MTYGSGKYTYEIQEGWGQLPEGWTFGWIPAVAVGSEDRIYIYSRSERPMVVFDASGNFIMSWGEDILKDLSGEYITEWWDFRHPDDIFIDEDDTVYVAELDQRVTILTLDGEVLAQWGSERGSEIPGEFFACPHGIWTDSHGDLYVGEVQADNRLQKFIKQK
ncbi:TPA: hypothetical protein EYP66_24635 [Candidatus Poribacteria bacterium]|nr:hypothetical protein [Candidatus Poribacteria bacterium]